MLIVYKKVDKIPVSYHFVYLLLENFLFRGVTRIVLTLTELLISFLTANCPEE